MPNTTDQAWELLIKSIPYPEQMTNLKTINNACYFTWRGNHFKLEPDTMSVYEVEGGCLVGSNLALLLRELIKAKTA